MTTQNEYPGVEYPDEKDVINERETAEYNDLTEDEPSRYEKYREQEMRGAALQTATQIFSTGSVVDLLLTAKQIENYLVSGETSGATFAPTERTNQ